MTNKQQTYTVAGHLFSLALEMYDPIWAKLSTCYAPFETAPGASCLPLFTVTAQSDWRGVQNAELLYKDPNPHPQDAKINVYRTDNGYLFELTPHGGGEEHSLLHLCSDLKHGDLLLRGNDPDRFCGINTALMLCYLLSTARMNTVLMHASVVMNHGKAYLFQGRSGTGKSTHSRLWLDYIPGSELLNDDHPIIRINTAGEAIVYGSPWSGKTPCYRNLSAPIGAIVRIKRAPHNQVRALSPLQAYASLLTSCSGMPWDKKLADGKDRTLQSIIASVPCYLLECLPDRAAVQLCAHTVCRHDTDT